MEVPVEKFPYGANTFSFDMKYTYSVKITSMKYPFFVKISEKVVAPYEKLSETGHVCYPAVMCFQ